MSLVKDAFKFASEGWKVYSNFEIGIAELISSDDILAIDKHSEIKNCVLCIDEIQIFFDSRRSMKKVNINFSHMLMQLRKRNIILLCTTQFQNSVDLRFRNHVDIIARPKFIKKYELCEVKYIDATAFQDEMYMYDNQKNSFVTIIYDATQIYDKYDTNTLI